MRAEWPRKSLPLPYLVSVTATHRKCEKPIAQGSSRYATAVSIYYLRRKHSPCQWILVI
jgi:hypothetical protein